MPVTRRKHTSCPPPELIDIVMDVGQPVNALVDVEKTYHVPPTMADNTDNLVRISMLLYQEFRHARNKAELYATAKQTGKMNAKAKEWRSNLFGDGGQVDDYGSDEDESEDKGDLPSYYAKAGFNDLPFVDWKTSYKAHLTHLAKAILMPYLGTKSIPDDVREANTDGNEETLRRIAIDKVIQTWAQLSLEDQLQ
ncbi:hypothetical protein AAL_06172 [Moelleriella libera RCEF 2490]|uniref:Uncharacterized protein n=1 Tax=Moelleriella libera RCEF 2490 TaxID=1081109 RepID=A0A167ZE99_9HYPO|nr:hypothetical protein AAL_06172 [Moelleriella libera RCEF 2490]